MSQDPQIQGTDEPAQSANQRLRSPAEGAPAEGANGAGLDPADEANLWQGRPSWRHSALALMGWVCWAILVLIGALALRGRFETPPQWIGWVALVLILLPGLYIGWKNFYRIYSSHYRLTTQRLFIARGLLARTTDQTELIRVDDVRVHKTIADRIFGVGTIEILSTDATDAHLQLEGIKTPDDVAEHIRRHMRILRKKSLYMESL